MYTINMCSVIWLLQPVDHESQTLHNHGVQMKPHLLAVSGGAGTLGWIYRMAGNFGVEFILADWRFWEQSANISSAKTLQCAVIFIRNHSFHVYNRLAAGRTSVIVGMEFTIDSCVRGYYVSKGFGHRRVGEELAC